MKAVTVDIQKLGISKFVVENLELPVPKSGEILVKITAVALGALENDIAKNDNADELSEYMQDRKVNVGLEFSGIVQKDGERFKKGDRVFGTVDLFNDEKAFSEYAAVKEEYMAHLPESLTFAEGAALSINAQTAFEALRLASVTAGQHILIIGANGGVGVYAIQLSKAMGAKVTAIGSDVYREELYQLGADDVFDYKKVSYDSLNTKFDIIFDLSNTLKFQDVENHLNEDGIFLNPNAHLDPFSEEETAKQKMPAFLIAHVVTEDLNRLIAMIAENKFKAIVRKTYRFSEYEEAFRELTTAPKFGKIVVEFE